MVLGSAQIALCERPKMPVTAAVGTFEAGHGNGPRLLGQVEGRVVVGVGHNLPQEAPRAFAKAIMDVDHF